MRLFHNGFEFEICDEWLVESGMDGFVRERQSYRTDRHDSYEVRIDEVEPVTARLRHGLFRDDAETGLTAKQRSMKILRGFAAGDAIPAVRVVRLPPGSRYAYKLTDGAHRFYLSIGAGFTHVPAVDGFDPAGF